MLNSKIKIYFLGGLALALSVGFSASADTDDVIFSQATTVADITLGSGTTEMTILSGSSTESLDITGGVFTVTNPGDPFTVSATNSDVGTIVILKNGSMESCAVNVNPGVSSVTLPIASGTYTIRPLEATSCSSLCPTLPGAVFYNEYPICGASGCSLGYVLTGYGSEAYCLSSSDVTPPGEPGGLAVS
jgi:hypothetical protein